MAEFEFGEVQERSMSATMEKTQFEEIAESNEQRDEELPSEDGDPPDLLGCAGKAIPCSVWFGPHIPRATEQELTALLGSRHGVAVLQWPRDSERAAQLTELGIPCLWFVRTMSVPPPLNEFQEWLPITATDQEIHEALQRLAELAIHHSAAPLELDTAGLHVGSCTLALAPEVHDLVALLVAHFEEEVDDSLLAQASERTGNRSRSLFGDLFRLDRSVNQVGLEIIPGGEHAHMIRRCRS